MASWPIDAIFSGKVFRTCLLSILFLNISSHSQKILLFISHYNGPKNPRGVALCRTQLYAPGISPLSHTHMLASFWVSGSGDANFTFILDFYHSNSHKGGIVNQIKQYEVPNHRLKIVLWIQNELSKNFMMLHVRQVILSSTASYTIVWNAQCDEHPKYNRYETFYLFIAFLKS